MSHSIQITPFQKTKPRATASACAVMESFGHSRQTAHRCISAVTVSVIVHRHKCLICAYSAPINSRAQIEKIYADHKEIKLQPLIRMDVILTAILTRLSTLDMLHLDLIDLPPLYIGDEAQLGGDCEANRGHGFSEPQRSREVTWGPSKNDPPLVFRSRASGRCARSASAARPKPPRVIPRDPYQGLGQSDLRSTESNKEKTIATDLPL